jgi:hypothetical protein
VLESLRSGAKGFVLRSGSAQSFFEALDQVRTGGVYLAPQVGANRLFVTPGLESTQDPIGHLSSREYQVTMLVDGVRERDCRTAGAESESRGYLSRQSDAKTGYLRLRRFGEVCRAM